MNMTPEAATVLLNLRPKDHINMRILHPGPKAQDKGHFRNHGLHDPCVSVVHGPRTPYIQPSSPLIRIPYIAPKKNP